MIQRLQYNPVHFTNNATNQQAPNVKSEVSIAKQNETEEQKSKFSIVDSYNKAKKGVTNVIKTANTTIGVGSGLAKGIVQGSLISGAIAIFGKNAKNGQGKIWDTTVGILKDAWKVITFVPGTIKKAWVNSPKENVISLFKSVPSGVKKVAKGVKNHRLTTCLAITAGLATVTFNTVKGKLHANKTNADLDHRINQGHV